MTGVLTPPPGRAGARRRTSPRRTFPLPTFPVRTFPLHGPSALMTALTVTAVILATGALSTGDVRLAVVVMVAIGALIGTYDTDNATRAALVCLPVVAFVRRITAGPSAYVLNDPLVLLPLVLLVPAALSSVRTTVTPPARWMLVLAGWLVASGALNTAHTGSTALYGTAVAVLPLLIGVQVALGNHRGLGAFVLRALPVVGVLIAAYGVWQYVAPPHYDLAWLTTQHDRLISVGDPQKGKFRIFGTAESPGTYAGYLGVVVVVLLVGLVERGSSRAARRRWLPAAAALLLVLYVLALTGVRTSLFAVPVVLTIVLVVDRRVPRMLIPVVVGIGIAAAFVLPSALASSRTSADRYKVGQISQDQSFKDRLDLLHQFGVALPGRPLGSGPGSTGLADRLTDASGGQANLDNGFLSRLIETGLTGLVLFLVAAVKGLSAPVRRLVRGRTLPYDLVFTGIAVYSLVLDFAGSNTSSLLGIFFWLSLGVLNRPEAISSGVGIPATWNAGATSTGTGALAIPGQGGAPGAQAGAQGMAPRVARGIRWVVEQNPYETGTAAFHQLESLKSGFLSTGVAALALPVAAVLTGPLLARALGPDGRGAVSATLAPLVLATTVATAGLPDAVTYFVARARGSARPVIGRAVTLTLGIGVLACLVLWALTPVLLKNFAPERGIFLALAVVVPLSLCVNVLRSGAQGLGRYTLVNAERWVSVGIRLGCLLVLYAGGYLDITRAIWITWLSGTLAGLVYLPLLRDMRRSRRAPRPPGLVRYGVRVWSGTVAGLLVLRLDQVMLGIFLGAREVGFYAVATALAEVPQTVVGAVSQLVFAKSAKAADSAVVARTCRIVVVVASVSVLVGCVLTPLVLPVMFGHAFARSVPLAQILFVATIPSTINGVTGAGLAAAGRPGAQSVATGFALVSTVALLVLLTPRYGVTGAAVSSLVSYAIGAVASVALFCRHTGIRARDCLVPRRRDVADLLAVAAPATRLLRKGRP